MALVSRFDSSLRASDSVALSFSQLKHSRAGMSVATSVRSSLVSLLAESETFAFEKSVTSRAIFDDTFSILKVKS